MRAEHNVLWQPIPEPPRVRLWSSVAEVIEAYKRAEPVRTAVSQRYSLVVTEPMPEPVWRKP